MRKILIVDDNHSLIDVERSILEVILEKNKNNYIIDSETSSKKAMKLICSAKYDLVLLDISMPELDGREIYFTVKSKCPQMLDKLIFISYLAKDLYRYIKDDCEAEINYIMKPFTPQSFRKDIEKFL